MRIVVPGLLDWPTLAADYGRYHTTRGNRICHAFGIPLIVLAIVSWTQWPAGNPVPLVAVLLPLYFLWDWTMGIGMTLGMAALSALATLLTPDAALGAFLLGWLLQLAGHKFFEGNSPAFSKNLAHLLVGPAWILRYFL